MLENNVIADALSRAKGVSEFMTKMGWTGSGSSIQDCCCCRCCYCCCSGCSGRERKVETLGKCICCTLNVLPFRYALNRLRFCIGWPHARIKTSRLLAKLRNKSEHNSKYMWVWLQQRKNTNSVGKKEKKIPKSGDDKVTH